MQRRVEITVECADVRQCPADVLVLKFADGLHGADAAVARVLKDAGVRLDFPEKGQWRPFDSPVADGPDRVIFIGVGNLYQLDYSGIRDFARTAITAVHDAAPQTRDMAITIHGPGYGLDEMESFDAEIAGLIDGLRADRVPSRLRRIQFVERDAGRAERLAARLNVLIPDGSLRIDQKAQTAVTPRQSRDVVRDAGYASAKKPLVFVAMPFHKTMKDVYIFGISRPANECGFICERADQVIFNDDIMKWVKERIAAADVVLADITGANANVYLEVGYAWGLRKETVLVIRDPEEPQFDLRAHRH